MGQQKRKEGSITVEHATPIFFIWFSPTWKGSNPSGSCLQVLLITLEERKAFDRNGFNIGEHMRVKIPEAYYGTTYYDPAVVCDAPDT